MVLGFAAHSRSWFRLVFLIQSFCQPPERWRLVDLCASAFGGGLPLEPFRSQVCATEPALRLFCYIYVRQSGSMIHKTCVDGRFLTCNGFSANNLMPFKMVLMCLAKSSWQELMVLTAATAHVRSPMFSTGLGLCSADLLYAIFRPNIAEGCLQTVLPLN